MGQDDIFKNLTRAGVLALAFLPGCKLEEQLSPTGPTGDDVVSGLGNLGANIPGAGSSASAITAPIISNPLSGSTVSASQPSLSVLNAARSVSETPTYLFQVSDESTFVTLEAQSTQVPEDPSGSTAWQVDHPLGDGTYYWRVRARAGTTDSAFSETATFTVGSSDSSPPPPGAPPPGTPLPGTVLADPLIGGSIGEVNGGAFTNDGWQVRSPSDYIRYEVPPISSGWVEFETAGLRAVNGSPDQFMLFGMWDPSAGPYRANPFRVHLQKLHPNPHNPPYLRIRWIANGEQHDEGSNFLSWNPQHSYQWRIEWGPSGSNNRVRVYLDGSLEIEVSYRRSYSPNVHFIELGIAERGESVVGAIYKNVRIGN